MKIRNFLFIGILTFGIYGCGNLGTFVGAELSGNSLASQAPTVVMDYEKALIVAHYAYDGFGNTLITVSAPGGLLHGKDAITVQFYYNKAGAALDAADQADAVGNAQGVIDQINQMNNLIVAGKKLIPSK